jgi:hypothetical protein
LSQLFAVFPIMVRTFGSSNREKFNRRQSENSGGG